MVTVIRRRRPSPPRPAPPSPAPPSPSPSPPVEFSDWATASRPGRPARHAPRIFEITEGPHRGLSLDGRNVVLDIDAPRPRCRWPECQNFALLAGVQPSEHLLQRRYRAWCYRHRPAAVRRDGRPPTTARPRFNAARPVTDGRPVCVVPGCGRPRTRKGTRTDGSPRYKRVCSYHASPAHRHEVPSPPDPVLWVTPMSGVTVSRTPRKADRRDRGFLGNIDAQISMKEYGRHYEVEIPPADKLRLHDLFLEDATPYRASTDSQLTHPYPTAAITTLFAVWRKGHA